MDRLPACTVDQGQTAQAQTHPAPGPSPREMPPDVRRARREMRRIRGLPAHCSVSVYRVGMGQVIVRSAVYDVEDEPTGAREPEGNARRVMSCGDRAELIETTDPFDRAHTLKNTGDCERFGGPRYMPAATRSQAGNVHVWVEAAKPRLYHPSQFNSHRSDEHPHGCTPDQVADALFDAQRRLTGVRGLGVDDRRTTQAIVCEKAAQVLGRRSFERMVGSSRAGLRRGELSAEEMERRGGWQ